MDPNQRLVVVSNRLPIVLDRSDAGWRLTPGSGGLVSALAPALSREGGRWIGWPGRPVPEDDPGWREAIDGFAHGEGYGLVPVPLTEEQVDGFYRGFSNGVLWPLFHDLVGRTDFEPEFWRSYKEVNKLYSEAILRHTEPTDFVWVHDYQLMLAAERVRRNEAGRDRRLGFFLHIPFPPVDIFLRLPWRRQILDDLLCYDLLGLQTRRDLDNFLACIDRLEPDAVVEQEIGRDRFAIRFEDRTLIAGAFPIGIDAKGFTEEARSDEVTARVEALTPQIGPYQIILGIDRLDYTKGLPEKMLAFRELLENHPDLREKVVLLQIVVPSREQVPEYKALKARLDRLVGQINGRFSTAGWVPIQYIYRSISKTDLVSLYRMARIALVTSLKDGMNLVAKEFVACQVAEPGNLALSEFAGAAPQLGDGHRLEKGALLFNPHDVEQTADVLYQALRMGVTERRQRMTAMQGAVAEQDIFWWLESFLDAVPAPAETTAVGGR